MMQLHAEVQDATTAMTANGFSERFNILVQEAAETRAFLRRKEEAIEELSRRCEAVSLLVSRSVNREDRPATSAEVAAITATLEKDHALLREEIRVVGVVAISELLRRADSSEHDDGSKPNGVNGSGLGPKAIGTLRQMAKDMYGLDL